MNVKDLINLLENYDDDTEVRIAQQPSWPFEYSITDAALVDLAAPFSEEGESDEEYDPNAEPKYVIYLVEGNQLGYLPGIAKNAIGW